MKVKITELKTNVINIQRKPITADTFWWKPNPNQKMLIFIKKAKQEQL